MKFIDSDILLAEATLEPVQGSRFQPTGFPSLGAAEFESVDDNGQVVDSLLVESSQSMANRLESVCLQGGNSSLADALVGMPFITLNDEKGNFMTNSLLEAHRISSSYMLENNDKTLYRELSKELDLDDKNRAVDITKLARFALKYDPNTILHGVFMNRKDIAGGRYRMTRSLSAFIEATGVRSVISGGVKMDHLDPKGGEGGAKSVFGHIPYSKIEYSAESIKVYFNIDLSLIRSYNLGDTANEFLLTLALWKIQSFLRGGLRLRTACHLKVKDPITVTEPSDVDIPDLGNLVVELKELIKKCQAEGLFTVQPLCITYKTLSKKSNREN